MGLIVDSSVVIAAERRHHTVRQILEDFRRGYGEMEIGLSAVTVVELVHGIYRAEDEMRRTQRRSFVDEVLADLPVYSITLEIARQAGRIEGEQAARGVRLPFEDLLIAATALHFGFAVATLNVRHFGAVPGLTLANL